VKVRRVVTGHDSNGKAAFASDESVDPVTVALIPGAEFHLLWGADHAPTFPDDGSPTPQPTYFPPLGGYASASSPSRQRSHRFPPTSTSSRRLPRWK
jgi:hypothetical protein